MSGEELFLQGMETWNYIKEMEAEVKSLPTVTQLDILKFELTSLNSEMHISKH
jgi:hypothetical protein